MYVTVYKGLGTRETVHYKPWIFAPVFVMEFVADTSKGSRNLIRNNVLKITYKMLKVRENEKEKFVKIKNFRNLFFGTGPDFSAKETRTTECSLCQIRHYSAPEKLR
jgi:hypothetical protein